MIVDEKLNNIVLALAGIFQAALLVKNIAETGQINESAYFASINSLYKIDTPDVPSVFGGKTGVLYGLQELKLWFDKEIDYKKMDINRYVQSLMYLERKLAGDKSKQDLLTRRIKQAVSQANYFSPTHPTVIGSLASIYVDVLGTYSYRIQVLGTPELLSKTEVSNKVRALLLAGIRATVLWRQLGGGRFQLIFSRYKLFNTVKALLTSIQSSHSSGSNNAST